MTTIDAQLEEAEDNLAATADILATLRTDMVAKEEGMDDPEHVDWLRNIEAKTNNDAGIATTVNREIGLRFNSIPKDNWKVFRI